MNEMDDPQTGTARRDGGMRERDSVNARSVQRTSFIRLHAKYRERGDVLTRDNHEIMRAISTTLKLILAFCSGASVGSCK